MTGGYTDVSNRVERRCDSTVPVAEGLETSTFELRVQLRLRAVDDHEVWPQRQDALGVRIDQRANLRECLHFGGELVEAADCHHLRAGADREQHLGNRGDERYDSPRRGGGVPALRQRRVEQEADECNCDDRRQLLRTSSHRKNGPPIMAVTMPTGISTGARMVRATRSHATTKRSAKECRCRQNDSMIDADQQANQVWHDDADEPDRPGQRHRGARGQRCAEKRQPLRSRHVYPACGGGILADAEQVE